MSIVAEHLKAIRPSETKAMTARAAALRQQGRTVITLSQGEPDFDTPASVCEAGIEAIRKGKTRYTAVAGIEPLRIAIARKLERDNGLHFTPEQITVGCGAKQVVFNALFASLNPGDQVVVPAPCWVSYPDMVRLAGGSPVMVDCPKSSGFKLTPAALHAAITPRTRWLMLNSPTNPTGAVYSANELRALAKVLERHPHVWVLSDDIYEKLVYRPAAFATMASAAPALADRTLTINGVSKTSCMTGWRVGYGAGPLELIKAMNVIQGQTSSHTSSISQYAAVEAIDGPQNHVAEFVTEFTQRRALVVTRLNSIRGLDCALPDGAFYAFAHCGGLMGRRTPAGNTIESDTDLAMYLLDAAGVAVVPGSGFMASPYLRISYASSRTDLERACDLIAGACDKLQ
jgi:aspartate aminotransferase